MAETTMATMAEMVCGRNVLWPNRSVDETSRKRCNGLTFNFCWNNQGSIFCSLNKSSPEWLVLILFNLIIRAWSHTGVC